MTDSNMQKKIAVVLRLAERAKELKGTTAGAYLACLCGMWTHTFKVAKDPLDTSSGELFDWYKAGIGASAQALKTPPDSQSKAK